MSMAREVSSGHPARKDGPVPVPNVFVVGPDEFNARKTEQLADEGGYAFHSLLTIEEVTSSIDFDLDAVLARSRATLDAFPGPIDGIIGYWDFPVSLIIPLIGAEYGLLAPPYESVLKCEHKYWSRLEQEAVAPEHVPRFQALDPFDDEAVGSIGLEFPFWIKPVKSFSSHLGFRVRGPEELRAAITAIRDGIRELGEAFNQFLARATLPEAVARVDGNHCIVEAIISGRQCTLEGFVSHGNIEVYGVVDSYRHANRSSFMRYEYPSTLPRRVVKRMRDICAAVIKRFGLDNSPFNIEFFWDRRTDAVWLLEINPRISQSHGDLFAKVDGTPHHRVAVDLSFGRKPVWRQGRGEFARAAKFFVRRFEDGIVTRVPNAAEIEAIEARMPGTLIEVLVEEGMRLSMLTEQDSYSYALALIFIGGESRAALLRDFAACQETLRFEFED